MKRTRKLGYHHGWAKFNEGKHTRDFTYVEDIVEGVVRTLDHVPGANPSWSGKDPDPATSRAPDALRSSPT